MNKILITQPRVGTSHNEILALQFAAKELGWKVLSAPGSWRLEDDLINSGIKGVPYGSQMFCEVIAQQMGWKLKANSFDWLAKLPIEFTKRKIEFMTLADAKKITELKFIKPADDKCFDAKIYEAGTFKPHELIPDDSPVLVSDVVDWDMEYRCFISLPARRYKNKQPSFLKNVNITWSNYLFHGLTNDSKMHYMTPGNLQKIQDYVKMILHFLYKNKMEIVPSVIDIGVIPGRGWAVIETNPAWASGLYGCDPIVALKVMSQAVEYNSLKE